jgi:hypothetical protein
MLAKPFLTPFSFLNDIQISIEKSFCLFRLSESDHKSRDPYDDTPNAFDGSRENSRNRLLKATVQLCLPMVRLLSASKDQRT